MKNNEQKNSTHENTGQNTAVMSARGIINRFGQQTVHDNLDLDITKGEVLGIAGGSGTGKSVLLRTLAGLHQPDAGEVLAEGRPVTSLLPAEKAAFLGMLFQHGALFTSLTVVENVELPLREHTQLAPEEQQSLAAIKLALAGLDAEACAKLPSALSGGMIKRAALARALALDPRVLLLDEPTTGLDPSAADGIDQLIAKLNETLGVTVVVVTHDLNTLFSVCDRVAILAKGKVIVGTPAELLNSKEEGVHQYLSGPRVDYARAAMSVMPKQNKNGQNKNGQSKANQKTPDQKTTNQKTTDQKTIGKDQPHEH